MKTTIQDLINLTQQKNIEADEKIEEMVKPLRGKLGAVGNILIENYISVNNQLSHAENFILFLRLGKLYREKYGEDSTYATLQESAWAIISSSMPELIQTIDNIIVPNLSELHESGL